MPFKKVGTDTYQSPSGRRMSGAQVQAYYAKENGGGLSRALRGKPKGEKKDRRRS